MMTGALKYANSCHSQNYVDKNINIFISYFERNENNETQVLIKELKSAEYAQAEIKCKVYIFTSGSNIH
jgi:uncharacterized protein with ACT and thioredoxin-like domain